jgi:hypothetical protein
MSPRGLFVLAATLSSLACSSFDAVEDGPSAPESTRGDAASGDASAPGVETGMLSCGPTTCSTTTGCCVKSGSVSCETSCAGGVHAYCITSRDCGSGLTCCLVNNDKEARCQSSCGTGRTICEDLRDCAEGDSCEGVVCNGKSAPFNVCEGASTSTIDLGCN